MDKTIKIVSEDTDTRFVNPYNFVPLAEKCQRKRPQINEQNCYTGYFECSMRLLTPLFIPNTSSSERLLQKEEYDEGKEKGLKYAGYDFFSYEDYSKDGPFIDKVPLPPSNPVIPGSEIRGTVRSVFEAAFNGCMSSVDGDRDLSRRCSEVKTPGVLYWDKDKKGWKLKGCNKARLRVEQENEEKNSEDCKKWVNRSRYERLSEGEEVWVKNSRDNMVYDFKELKNGGSSRKDGYIGYLHKGEYIKDKKYEAVFLKPEGRNKKWHQAEPIKVREEDIELLEKLRKEYKDEKKNSKAQKGNWYKEFNVNNDSSKILVYYSMDSDGHVYMCPACIGRESFKKKIKNLLKYNGGYQPCNDENLCPACEIFGMMDKSEKPGTNAYGSKIRITDATLINSVENSCELFEEPIVLPELGEPRPSAAEFYTEPPYNENHGEQNYWTYDYKFKDQKVKGKKPRTALKENEPKIRGRKFYWHSKVNLKAFKGNQVSAMQQRIRPLKPGDESDPRPTFQFRVYFEQLDKIQLEQLKWALDLGDPDCAHKIGRGKPLGFGSVQIRVDGLFTRNIDEETGRWETISIGEQRKESYNKFFDGSGFSNEKIPEELKIMSNWKKRPSNVSYPLGENKIDEENINAKASHQWFRLNRTERSEMPHTSDTKEKNFDHNFAKVLPTAKEDADKNLAQEKALYKLIEKKK